MQLTVRPIETEDYANTVAIHNQQNEPDMHQTAEQMQRSDARRLDGDPEFCRVVAEAGGQIAGTASILSTWGGLREAHRYWVLATTRADLRHQGVDVAMIQALVEMEAAGEPRELWTCIRQDFLSMVDFLDAFDFTEEFRSWGSHLDLTAFDFEPIQAQKAALEAEGIRFTTYAALDDPDREAKVLALHRQSEDEAPHYEPIIPKKFDEDIRHPTMPDESCYLAVDGESVVGMASLLTGDPRFLRNGLTGVLPAYRNRGIATVLKALAADHAKRDGHADINAAGSGANQAMLRVNRKLGYDIEPPWITLKAELSEIATDGHG